MSSSKQFIFGMHAAQSLLQNHPARVIRVYIQAGSDNPRLASLQKIVKEQALPFEFVSAQELARLTNSNHHQGIAILCTQVICYTENDLSSILQNAAKPPLVLVLDGVQDPHNLGACFRSADAASVNAIIAPKDKSVGMTPIVSKVASGAAEVVPFVQVTNLVRTLEQLKAQGIWIYGADAHAEQTLYQADLSGPSALVLGAEGKGLRRLTREHCDLLIKIPMFGTVASLNVSVAAGIFLFEAVRQRVTLTH